MRLSVWIIRALFIVAAVLVAIVIERTVVPIQTDNMGQPVFWGFYDYIAMVIGLVSSLVIVVLDIIFKRKSVAVIVAVCVGLLAGALLEGLVSKALGLTAVATHLMSKLDPMSLAGIELAILLFFCYLAVTIILQTREDFRIVIPYIKFSPEGKEPPPFVLDTSVIIDGRIADIAETGILDNPLLVPRFVLNELQSIADSADRLKRNRGRRGLDILNRLQKCPRVEVDIRDMLTEAPEAVDTKLIRLAKTLKGRVVTNDFNLNKIAQLQQVEVVNINDLAQALRPVVLPGEEMEVKIIRPGEEVGQGVGYLDDGTMVVVEQGRDLIGQTTRVVVSNVYQTSAGRMIFGRPEGTKPSPRDGRNSGHSRH